MFIRTIIPAKSFAAPVLGRRSLLGLTMMAALPLGRPALADTGLAEAAATVSQFNAALVAVMKAAGQAEFNQRFQALAPAVDKAFDLREVLSLSVGFAWAGLPAEEQVRLLDAFRRYTVASYVANFSHYAGQQFSVSPDTRSLGAGRVVVPSRITSADGDTTEIDYVMQRTTAGWKVVDVLAAGSISRVAVQRSDFRHLLAVGGGAALLASLQRKTADLSGGAVA